MVSSPLVRASPRPPPSPRPHSTPSASSPTRANVPGERSIIDKENDNGDAPSTPVHHDHQWSLKTSRTSTARTESSPLKVAASLIQSLDIAHTEMTSFAADAAVDAERARRNARTAQEIVRRYQNRSYPTSFNMDAFEAPTSAARSKSVDGTGTVASSSFAITISRPKRPEIMRFHNDVTPSRKSTLNGGLKRQNGEEKNYDNDGNDNDNAGVYVSTTPVRSKQRGMQDKASTNSSVPTRGGFHSPASYERISQHHADDLLQLTQELERAKQALKSEQRLHKDCQSSLASLQSKKIESKNKNQKLVEKHDMEQKQSTMQISHLEQELELSRSRLEAAEEDAQLALDLATDSAEERDKMEESLRKAEKEIEMLKEEQQNGKRRQLATVGSPKLNVHFADDIAGNSSTNIGSAQMKRENGPPRSMIAAGRQILLRRNMSPQDAVIRIQLSPAKSVERRQQLCRRLNEHLNESSTSNNEDANIALLSSSPSRTPLSPTPGNKNTSTTTYGGNTPARFSINGTITKKELEEYHTAMKILEISGKRLDLDGYGWREHSKTMIIHNPIQIDVMTRQYCQNVEVRTTITF
jgi:hypothetical protein